MNGISKNHEVLTLKELQEEELDLLVYFDAFCREHGLRYSLDSGTLLGAIRHKGFIPWDDDVDVNMPRPDYDRLMALASELPAGFHIVDARNSNFAYGFAKFCTDAICAQEPAYEGIFEEKLWIDIFPMDGVSSNDEISRLAQKRIQRAVKNNVWATVNHKNENFLKRVVKNTAGFFLRLSNPRKRMLRVIDDQVSRFKYESAARVAFLVSTEALTWTLPKDEYEKTIDMEFEGHMFPVMSCWDECLTALYGDYMQLPPEDQRQSHCLKAWRC